MLSNMFYLNAEKQINLQASCKIKYAFLHAHIILYMYVYKYKCIQYIAFGVVP